MNILTAKDKTVKISYDNKYHSVIIPTKNKKYTVCVSCQIGCPIGCTFCYAGTFKQNLTSQQIITQVKDAKTHIGTTPTSVVFMGIGEPLTNFSQVQQAVEQIHQQFHIPYNKITVSTSGMHIHKLAQLPCQGAFSLHTPFEDERKKLIPLTPPLSKILTFIQTYCQGKKHGIMIEYTLIDGVNDTEKHLQGILDLELPKNVHINLIERNPKKSFQKSKNMQLFKDTFIQNGYKCFIRQSRGEDIQAACGMLDYDNS
ncbi:MAG: radical SAM protein [Candidatus Woesearchaeota archaeon]